MNKRPLSPTEKKIYEYVLDYRDTNGEFPTYERLTSVLLKGTSRQNAFSHCLNIHNKGWWTLERNKKHPIPIEHIN